MALSERQKNFGAVMAAITNADPARKARASESSRRSATTHGLKFTPEYDIWHGMKQRCLNPKSPVYALYGGRGITIWIRWLESFVNFIVDVGPRPSDDYSIDRWPDPDGNYEPGNVRWATDEEQNRNRGDFNKLIESRGVTRTVGEWVEVTGLPRDSVYWRLSHGWSPERTFTEPMKHGRRPSPFSLFPGVAFHKKSGKYFAFRGHGTARHYVGSFNSAQEAYRHAQGEAK